MDHLPEQIPIGADACHWRFFKGASIWRRFGQVFSIRTHSKRRLLAALAMSVFVNFDNSPIFASSFGYTLNMTFSSTQIPIREPAGKFDDRVWNNYFTPNQTTPIPLQVDVFGRPSTTQATITWESAGIGRATGIQAPPSGDRQLMEGYLNSPAKITLRNLDAFIPVKDEPITGSLILYAYGGQANREGTYRVGTQVQRHVDSGLFDGTFTTGLNGNTLIFPNVLAKELVINTEGFAPMNAMSMIYCRPGDLDGDGSVGVSDLNILSEAVKHGPTKKALDVNFDLSVDFNDVMSWIKCSKGTCIGDVNLDGVFNSTDLVLLFQNGGYETGNEATWITGDWNGDCKFDSTDLLVAFQEGCYESEATMAMANLVTVNPPSVPEPTAFLLVLSGIGLLDTRRSRRRG